VHVFEAPSSEINQEFGNLNVLEYHEYRMVSIVCLIEFIILLIWASKYFPHKKFFKFVCQGLFKAIYCRVSSHLFIGAFYSNSKHEQWVIAQAWVRFPLLFLILLYLTVLDLSAGKFSRSYLDSTNPKASDFPEFL
jgi:hypothetical protein